ncbi:Oidioi.mRNA.OKI2018_I69.chr1.g301.t1.cds [Oikopleura dioica]|uniref:Oidioi.mRNA.OKI2018_I69.chr1.g301.t1.cds n=1 Tax=Oikopleura dioica TaxID=34765 RepID=A0ABN7SJF1_OIKDI|nr:Oidioi.mRNA.OKI2018_I69.chr1.g301.t1.cds [Oikopleura dioica]
MSSREIEILIDPADVCPYKDGAPEALPEGNEYFYGCDSCCTEEMYSQVEDTASIDVWAFSGCSNETEIVNHEECINLSKQIHLDLTCSPNNFLWLNPTKNALKDYPLCADFCSGWFDACKNVPTCTFKDHKYWPSPNFSQKCEPDGEDIDPNFCRDFGTQFPGARTFCMNFFSEMGEEVIIQAPASGFCVDPLQPEKTLEHILAENEIKLQNNQSYPVFDCQPGETEITWWMWLLIILFGVGVIGGVGYFFYWFFVLRKKKESDENNRIDMYADADAKEENMEMGERQAEQENQAYVQDENGEGDSIANDLQSQAPSVQSSQNPTIPPAMTPINQLPQQPMMQQAPPYSTMQSIQPIPMSTQQMMYGNPYASMPYNPQMQMNPQMHSQMNPQMMNQQIQLIPSSPPSTDTKTAAAQPQIPLPEKQPESEPKESEPANSEKPEEHDFDMTLPKIRVPMDSDSSSSSDDSEGQRDFEAQILGTKIEEKKEKEQENFERKESVKEFEENEAPDLNEIPTEKESAEKSEESGEKKEEQENESPPPPKPRRLSLAPSPIQLRAQKTLSVDSQGSILTQDSQSKEEFALDENSADEIDEIKEDNAETPEIETKDVEKSEEPTEKSKPIAKKDAGMAYREVKKYYGLVNTRIKNELKLQKGDKVQILYFSAEADVLEIRIPRTDESGNFPKKYLNIEEKMVRYDAGSFYSVAFSYEPNTDKLLKLVRDEEIQIIHIPEEGKYVTGQNKAGKEGQLLLEELEDSLLKAGRVPEGAKEPIKTKEEEKSPPKNEKPKKSRKCVLL